MNQQVTDIQTAVAAHQAGDLTRAEAIYREILRTSPQHADALHLLGVLAHQRGDNQTAVANIERAIAVLPTSATYYNNLGAAQLGLGRLEEAFQSFQRASQLQSGYADPHFNLGDLYQRAGRLDEALSEFAEVIRLQPAMADAHYRMGLIRKQMGDADAAIADLQRYCAQDSQNILARFELGNTLLDNGRLEEAIDCYQAVVERDPQHHRAHGNLGVAYMAQQRLIEAEQSCRAALNLQPELAAAHNTLGSILREQGLLSAATKCFENTISYAPDSAEGHSNMAGVLLVAGQPSLAVAGYRRALEINPTLSRVHSNLLMAMHYDPSCGPDEIYREHLRWNQIHLPTSSTPPVFSNSPDPNRRLRIGYLSADFRAHSVGYLIEPVLAAHDANQVEVTCYSEVSAPDEVTQRIRASVSRWRNTYGQSDDACLHIIREDEIDVLVDLAGHTGGHRLAVFARHAAPVQVTHLGYGSTTGVPAIGYRLTDHIADPPGEPRRHTEELIRLPTGLFCYHPPPNCPAVTSPPIDSNGFVTFGSFNNLAKIGEPVLDLWAELLRSIPHSRLLMKNCSFADQSTQDNYRQHFLKRGIAGDRLELLAHAPSVQQHLALYGRVDITLDSFPYTGATTSCESLWMGVPVVTLSGVNYVGRLSASLLMQLGLGRFIAHNDREYLRIVQQLAADHQSLVQLRSSLRKMMTASNVCDATGAARALEQAYRMMWQRWCPKARMAG